MRRTEVLIGAAAIVVASVSATLYLVNISRRGQGKEPVSMVRDTEQVLSPRDLLAGPKNDSADEGTTAPDTADALANGGTEQPSGDAATQFGSPAGTTGDSTFGQTAPVSTKKQSKVIYPTWTTSDARVEEARAVTDPAGYISPVWSPVGLDIAFTTERRDVVYITGALPGSTPRALINDKGCGEDYSWNADGMSMRVRAADGLYDQVLITGERYPGGARPERVFARDEKIFFVPTPRLGEGKEVQVSGPEDRFSAPELSPDESRVVYRGAETGLYIAAADGSGAVSIGPGTNPSWLPDSSGIVYDQQVSDGRAVVDADLWVAMADGSIRSNLTRTPGIVELYPNVAPDGERIAFTAAGSVYVGKLARGK